MGSSGIEEGSAFSILIDSVIDGLMSMEMEIEMEMN